MFVYKHTWMDPCVSAYMHAWFVHVHAWVHICVDTCMCVWMYGFVCMYVSMHICKCECIYVYTWMYMNICAIVCAQACSFNCVNNVDKYVCMHVYNNFSKIVMHIWKQMEWDTVCMYMYACIYVCIYIYIYIGGCI